MKAPGFWAARGPLACALLPLAGLFAGLAAARRAAYRRGWKASVRLPVPVVVVGNISVGGTGKTPLLLALAEGLRAAGRRPGIVSRGYGGNSARWPREVPADGNPFELGDEPVLLAARARCPVWAGPDRVAAARALLAAHPDIDLILSDDGLQHYRLGRTLEIAVVDGCRRLGNGWPLPAGPLREPPSRLRTVDFVVVNGGSPGPGELGMRLAGELAWRLDGEGAARPLADFGPVHAVAGIGDPGRFFAGLEAHGLAVCRHPFPDHHAYVAAELGFAGEAPVLMTEKDAVKCRRLGLRGDRWWVLPVRAEPEPALMAGIIARLSGPGGRAHCKR